MYCNTCYDLRTTLKLAIIDVENINTFMSKKHFKQQGSSSSGATLAPLSQSAEYRIIQHDLIRVIALNVLYLAAVLVLYFTNQRTQYLDRLLEHWLHF